ncbi:PP0621 family protein [Halopseudomonas sp.]|uniref:PP0621 family protein n=1 Tax=Halopseudomonas sp. TaxID=2901191 RepID=UPI00311EFA40
MGLIKLIILAALVWVGLRFWRALQHQRTSQQTPDQAPPDAPVMVRCAQCQVHLPQSRALRAGDQWYCCAEHRDEHSDS